MKNIFSFETAKVLMCLCCFFLVSISASSQETTVTLKFIDVDTGQPISDLFILYNPTGNNSQAAGGKSVNTSIDFTDVLGELTIPLISSDVQFNSIEYGNQTLSNFVNHGTYFLRKSAHGISSAVVLGYSLKKPLYAQPAAISFIDISQLNQDQGASIQNQLNNQPGIQMESRGYGGSRRLSIRGSFIRSPFAVRNIK
ncbi:MAG: TonB-dependent receptor plug domain-containing protein, partial [Flavobacteriales bacterium]